jgi:ABC-type Fe3+/spermidine/putrescine transport system ATPase subunit
MLDDLFMNGLAIDGVSKSFGNDTVLRDISIDMPAGSVVTLLGPSGCGKTTLLRIIAGLERADSGRIAAPNAEFFDCDAGRFRAPQDRRLGFVFQDYGLWPHMTVFDNVAFPLEMQRTPKSEIKRRVLAALAHVHLEEHAPKKPHQLSGGQKQRVSIARAIVGEPALILLDEPLSNLDANLREELGNENRLLCKRLGLTCVNVTHDRREAQILSDTVALMKDGRIHQQGAPHQLFNAPRDVWTATFLNAGNLLSVDSLATSAVSLPAGAAAGKTLLYPRNAITLCDSTSAPRIEITNIVYIEDRFELTGEIAGQSIRFFHETPVEVGEFAHVALDPGKALVL